MPELILNADDYGYSPAVNLAIEHLALAGRITSFTIMANFETAARVGELATKLSGKCSIGLHVNLTEGRPVLEPCKIPSLVQSNGELFPHDRFVRRLLTARIRGSEIRSEVVAQIRRIQLWLGQFSHFDSHHHVHRFPQVINAIALAAAEAGAPRRIRTNRRFLASGDGESASVFRLWQCHFQTYPLALPGLYFKARQLTLLRRHHFASPDYLLTAVPPICPKPVAPAAESWSRVWQNLPEATYEINWHPGRANREENLLLSSAFGKATRIVQLVPFDRVGTEVPARN
jgi:predicted glycoside hydrolase/deacetylase ChbG (UPF0249 family)